MATGFNPFKKLWGSVKPGGSGLLGMRRGAQSISPAAAKDIRSPLYTISREKMMSQPYPDRLLKIQAAKNLGWDPNFKPDVSGYPPSQRDLMTAKMIRDNEALSPTGSKAAGVAKDLAGEPAEFEYLTKELDQDFVSEALASALGGPPELPSTVRPPSGSQPGPGDFSLLLSDPSPLKKKKKNQMTLEEIGLLA